MKDYNYYLFDADGTLIDTADMICECFKNTCKVLANKKIEREEILPYIGMPLKNQLEIYLGKMTNDDLENAMSIHMDYQLKIYRKYLKPFDNIPTLLLKLKQLDKKLAVVTSRRQDTAGLYLKETGIYDFFDIIVTPELTTEHKPNPAPVLKALEILKAPPQKTIMIGDASFDIKCGNSANVDTAFVLWSNNKVESLGITPTYVIDSALDLLPGK